MNDEQPLRTTKKESQETAFFKMMHRRALESPCFTTELLAEAMKTNKFAYGYETPKVTLNLIMTISTDDFERDYFWHLSVSILGKTKAIKRFLWNRRQRYNVKWILEESLEGCGLNSRNDTVLCGLSVQRTKPLTVKELIKINEVKINGK